MRLETDGRTFEFGREHGIVVRELDFGFPEVREVEDERTDADGMDDRTSFHAARPVTIRAVVTHTSEHTLDEVVDGLRALCRPNLRPYLYFDVDGSERRVRLRADQQSAPLSDPTHRRVQASWRAPDGIIEAADLSVSDVSASTDTEKGRSYDLSYDRTYPESAPVGAATVANDGTTDAWPVVRIYGPCTDPQITNETVDRTLRFVGLTVAAGDYLELDMRERTALLNGATSRYSRLDFSGSQWWPLNPGDNLIRFHPVAFSGASQAQIRYRHAWL